MPGISTTLEAIGAIAGTQKMCEEVLKQGNLIAIYPGGTRESLFSDSNYTLIWENRKGFAKLAIQTKSVCLFFVRLLNVYFNIYS